MKLNKKRISILVSLMCLLVLLVFTLCSFDLPEYVENFSEMLTFSQPSQVDVSTVTQIINFQQQLGQFNSLELIALFYSPSGIFFCLFSLPKYEYTVSVSSNITFSMVGTAGSFIQIGLSADGFSVYNTAGYTVSTSITSCIFYRLDNSDITYNSNFVYSNSSAVQPGLTSIYNYWDQFYTRVLLYPGSPSTEELESAYQNGVETGYIIGWDEGYETGYKSGYDYGLADGYETGYGAGAVDGYVDGYNVGYDTGYSDGYDTGYDSGYSDAERETVVEYVEPFEIDIGRVISGVSSVPDNIMNGSFDFELFGINVYGLLKLLIILFVVSAIVVFIIKRAS